jgi:LuxR family transcriptional regulator, maltose regulon positive regulatory protein
MRRPSSRQPPDLPTELRSRRNPTHAAPSPVRVPPKAPPLAKVSRPRPVDVLLRKRLLGQLDRARGCGITWVSGPAGSGKTTLVASWVDAKKIPCLWYQLDERDAEPATFFYFLGLAVRNALPRRRRVQLPSLTVEYARNVPTFTKRYFERLCSVVSPPFVLVLDNFQNVVPDRAFHEVLREAASVLPRGISLTIVSRLPPPPALSSLRAYGTMHFVHWEDLKFDLGETRAMLSLRRRKRTSPAVLANVHRMTEGWAAGLVLFDHWMAGRTITPRDLDHFERDGLFEYFATEFFEKADPDTREFLLETSFLQHVAPSTGAELTGRRDAGALLATLCRNHFFTERRSISPPVYDYHPLFRGFLQARAREIYTQEELLAILGRVAALLERLGQVEDAAELYREARHWEGLARLIIANAAAMISHGRHRALEAWLGSLPQTVLESTPWLLYWMGTCRIPFAPREGRSFLERSFALFRSARDAAGAFLAWSGVVYAINVELGDVGELDPWIATLDELLDEHAGAPIPASVDAQVKSHMFMALALSRPDHPDFDAWRAKAHALVESDANLTLRMITAFYLLVHGLWSGDHAEARRLLELIRGGLAAENVSSPAARRGARSDGREAPHREHLHELAEIMGMLAESWCGWSMGSPARSLSSMSAGLARSRETGVHMWDFLLTVQGVAASLCMSDLPTARKLLDGMAPALGRVRLLDKFYYHHESSWYCRVAGDVSSALYHQRQAHALAAQTGLAFAEAQSHFAMAHLMLVSGERAQAEEHLARCRERGRHLDSRIVAYMCSLTSASFALAAGDEDAALADLREAFALGRMHGFVFFSWWHPSLMLPLCTKALEAGIETEYVAGLIRECNLWPEDPPLHVESWPYPIRIHTLGSFRIVRAGEPLRFAGKLQKRPLELLKALIAFGGKDVEVERLVDALWPDADADLGHRSFETALYRLRRLLAHEGAIQLQGGRLSLSSRHCWLDVWAFERSVQSANGRERAIALYRGPFLADDAGRPWTASAREQLRASFQRLVGTAAA